MVWMWLLIFLSVGLVDVLWLGLDLFLYLFGFTPVSEYGHAYPLFGFVVVAFQLLGVFALAMHLYVYPLTKTLP